MTVPWAGGNVPVMGGREIRSSRIRMIWTMCALSCAWLALALPAAADAASGNSDVAPIVGTWKSDGAVIEVSGSGGAFQGVVQSGVFANCPNLDGPGAVVWNMSGAKLSYSGTIPWVNLPDCTPQGDGPSTWTMTDSSHGTLHSTSPDGTTSDSASFTRVGAAPGAGGGGASAKTDCKKGGQRVLCPAQKKVVKKVRKIASASTPTAKGYKKAGPAKQSAKLMKATKLSADAQPLVARWSEVGLPKRRGVANAKFGASVARGWVFLGTMADITSKTAEIGDRFYANAGTDGQSAFDHIAAQTVGEPVTYSSLNSAQRAVVVAIAVRELAYTATLVGPLTDGYRDLSRGTIDMMNGLNNAITTGSGGG
jgi:hypothetical protein